MKKTIILSIALACIALGSSISIKLNAKKQISFVLLKNVEALSDCEAKVEELESGAWLVTVCNRKTPLINFGVKCGAPSDTECQFTNWPS